MSIVQLRLLFLGTCFFVFCFNRWAMTRGDLAFKARRALGFGLGFVVLPVALSLLLPHPLWAWATWGLAALLLGLEGFRIVRRELAFLAVRSLPADVPGLKEHGITTRALQVRSYQFHDVPPELKGLTVAFLADLHADGFPEPAWYDRLWQSLGLLRPDLVLLGGDFVSRPDSLPILRRCLQGVDAATVPLGVWAVLGNHDECVTTEVGPILESAGVHLLRENWVSLTRPDGQAVTLAGTNAPWNGAGEPTSCIPPGGVHLALTHTPDNASALVRAGARFVLAGHLHGGQVALPLLGGILSPSKWSRHFLYGHHFVGKGGHLVVTSGVGVTGLPLRVLCHPEIALLRFL